MRTLIAVAATLGLLAWPPAPVTAQEAAPAGAGFARSATVDEAVGRELARQKLIGVAVGVIQGGKVAYTKGYGLADREAKRPATDATVFNWASNSKPLAATLAMQLRDQGRLDLDADVRKYVPEFPEKPHVITARHLLAHQSGIPHYSNGRVLGSKRPAFGDLDPIASLGIFDRSPLLFQPGEKESYSSYAYVLLSAVVARAGGQPFDDQMRERIARPLGLKTLQLDVSSAGHDDWAVGYTKNTKGQVVPAPEEAHAWKLGAGGYKSDVRDFARWAVGVLNRELVSEAAETLMWAPQRTNRGAATGYGLGLGVATDAKGELRVSHNGKQAETSTRLEIHPRRRLGVVVLCNCDFADSGAIASAVLRAIEVR